MSLVTVAGRELDLVRNYTGHRYDDVLDVYFAQARMYDPINKRFMAVDPVKGSVVDPMSMVPYLYVQNNPLKYVDPDGLFLKGLLGGIKSAATGFGELVVGAVVAVDDFFTKLKCEPTVVGKTYRAISNTLDQTVGKALKAVDKLPTWAKVGIGAVGTIGAVALTVLSGGSALPVLLAVGGGTVGGTALGAGASVIDNRISTGSWSGSGQAALKGAGKGTVDGFMFGGAAMFGASAVKAAQAAKVARRLPESNVKPTAGAVSAKPVVELPPKGASKWTNADSTIKWPSNRGYKGIPKEQILHPGTRIDRYGYEGGTFVSPEGTPYANRALAPGTEIKPYNVYEVVKPVKVQAGEIAPWFDQPGGGIQYEFNRTIQELINAGILRRVTP